MQTEMVIGFIIMYPVNCEVVKYGVKYRM